MNSLKYIKKNNLAVDQKTLHVFILLIILLVVLLSACNENSVDSKLPIEAEVKIVSPINNAKFLKHEEIIFKACLLSGNDTLNFESIKWDISGYSISISVNNYKGIFNVGQYEVTCIMYKDNIMFSNKVVITVENKIIVDTVSKIINLLFIKFLMTMLIVWQ